MGDGLVEQACDGLVLAGDEVPVLQLLGELV